MVLGKLARVSSQVLVTNNPLSQPLGPQTFRPKDAPRYIPAEITIIICWGVCLILLVGVWFWYKRENRLKAEIRAQPGYLRLENQESVNFFWGGGCHCRNGSPLTVV